MPRRPTSTSVHCSATISCSCAFIHTYVTNENPSTISQHDQSYMFTKQEHHRLAVPLHNIKDHVFLMTGNQRGVHLTPPSNSFQHSSFGLYLTVFIVMNIYASVYSESIQCHATAVHAVIWRQWAPGWNKQGRYVSVFQHSLATAAG